jgi:type II secretory pathway pseudopilin PulG
MPSSKVPTRFRRQAGYTLLMVVFMVATILILAGMAAPNLLTQGRREREAETVWRGEQYERAIGLYFTKFGKYPTSIEDLTKQTNGLRFLRQAYKDPTNKEDGSWRFIYVGPNGQLIGSVRQTSLLQNLVSAPPVPGATPFGLGPQGGPAPPPPAGTAPGATPGATDGTTPGATPGVATGAPAANPLESQPQPLEGTVLGGNIIGVGSKTKQSSLRVYQRGDKYEEWEFIWNPNQQGQAVPTNLPPTQAAPGTTPPGGVPAPGVPPASGNTPPATTF